MNWHTRYTQQANWTRELRSYIFHKTKVGTARRILEVGCGTGAILSELPEQPDIYGLDINRSALIECVLHAPRAALVEGNALELPFPDRSFDIIYSHYFLLWIKDPLQALKEMKRASRGYIIAFAEPDYQQRLDRPDELIPLGRLQTESLIRQGADPSLGARLAELFFEAGIKIVETGTIQSHGRELSPDEWELEWDVIESDLTGWVPEQDIQKMKRLDQRARQQGTRVLQVPTYFAWGQI